MPYADTRNKLVFAHGIKLIAWCDCYCNNNVPRWSEPLKTEELKGVTHWMDLPEPPPKPADPFEDWWFSLTKSERYNRSPNDSAKMAWNAAKEHYERQLPDFEAWRKANGDSKAYVTVGVYTILSDVAQSIWSAAQGKQGG